MWRATVLLLGLTTAVHGVAWACSCIQPAPVPDAAAASDLVVFAEVRSVKLASSGCGGSSSMDPMKVTLEVIEGFVGAEDGDVVVVHTASSGASCGVEFEEGQTWLVYGLGGDTSLCSRTRQAKPTDPELEELRAL